MPDNFVGKELPTVALESSEGGTVKLPADLRGKWTLLYFYPKDDTPGCTKQACSYRDNIGEFKKLDVRIYGVSGDDLGSHGAFKKKYELNFPLLADTEHKLSAALATYGEQEWQGKKSMGLSRDTFLVDPQGKITDVWRKVSPATTTAETLAAIKKHLGK